MERPRLYRNVGAVHSSGWVAATTIEAAIGDDVFLAYLEQVLCPELQPDVVVVMDNLSAHKVNGVHTRIEPRRAQLLYLPPYSHDFNPIEKCWAQVKQRLRAAKARSLSLLEQSLSEVHLIVTCHNIQAYFRHSDYAL